MQEHYKKANDSIHVPEDLMEQTREKMRREEQKKKAKTRVIWRWAAVAACFCVVGFGAWSYMGRDRIIVQDIEISQPDMSVGITLGKQETEDGSDKPRADISTFDTPEEVPEELWEVKPSRINGRDVYIGRTDETTWHVAFEENGKYNYFIARDMSEEELKEFLKYNVEER